MSDKSAQNRARIVEAAQDLVYRQTFAATSLADVATAAQLQKGHLTYYFKTKDELAHAVADAHLDAMRARLEAWTRAGGTPYETLDRFVSMLEQSAPQLAAYGCPLGTLCDELGKAAPDLQRHARAPFDLLLHWLATQFATHPQALTATDTPPPEATNQAEHLLAMAEGAALLAHAYRDPTLIHRQANHIRQWLRTLLPASPP